MNVGYLNILTLQRYYTIKDYETKFFTSKNYTGVYTQEGVYFFDKKDMKIIPDEKKLPNMVKKILDKIKNNSDSIIDVTNERVFSGAYIKRKQEFIYFKSFPDHYFNHLLISKIFDRNNSKHKLQFKIFPNFIEIYPALLIYENEILSAVIMPFKRNNDEIE